MYNIIIYCIVHYYDAFYNNNSFTVLYRNVLTQQLIDISAKSHLANDFEVPMELLNYIDQGVECNPERFQFELYADVENSSVTAADKVKRLKVQKLTF